MLRALSGEDSSGETRTFENALLEEAVTALYRVRALRGASSFTPMTDFVRTLGDVGDVGEQPLTPEMRKTASSLAFKLSSACGTSSLGRMLDAPSSVDLSHRILYFDASSLKEDPTLKRIRMLLVSYLLWKRTKTAPRDRVKLAVLKEFGVLAQPRCPTWLVGSTSPCGAPYWARSRGRCSSCFLHRCITRPLRLLVKRWPQGKL